MSAENFFLCKVFILFHIELHRPGRSHHFLSLCLSACLSLFSLLSLSTHLRRWLYIRVLEYICGRNIGVKQNNVKIINNRPIKVLK